jgi:uncharacterized repeat protein (TIGR01451 family)
VLIAFVVLFLMAAIMLVMPEEMARAGYISWVEYPSNPVYDPAGDWAWFPCVLYDASQFSGHGTAAYYKMWYQDFTAMPYQKVVYSSDGINWGSAVNMTGLTTNACQARIVYISGAGPYYYKIWYWNGFDQLYNIDELRTADSTDGVNWVNEKAATQDATYQLVTGVSPDWNCGTYGPVDVFYNPSAGNSGTDPFNYTFAMYYDATTGGEEVTGLAYSADGAFWTRYHVAPYENAPVLPHGGSSDWDSAFASFGTVIRESTGVWHMWYSGGQTMVFSGIGYATSTDGINWTKSAANPVLSAATGPAWRNSFTAIPSVIFSPTRFDGHGNASRYKMWFSGRSSAGNYAIGYMYSQDPSLSLSITPVPSGTVQRGSVIVYTLLIRNDGGAPATSCSVSNSFPAFASYITGTTTLNGVPIAVTGGASPLVAGMAVNSPGKAAGTIAPGAEAVVTFIVQVGNDLPLGAEIRNTARLTADGMPPVEASSVNPSPAGLPATWYFAEGSNQPGFDEYILLSNMGDSDMTATITYLTEGGTQRDVQHLVPAHSRRTVYVNAEMPGETGVAAIVTGQEGLICERSMYYLHNGIRGGDNVIGANAPSIDLFFAEGFTGTPASPFEEWILLLNPGLNPSRVIIDYLFTGGSTVQKEYTVGGMRRLSINVDGEVGEGREVSAHLRSELPVIAERAMYFNYNGKWPGGHNGMAATGARSDWYLAEGYTGWEGSQFDEWILVANENDQAADITITYMFPDGSTKDVQHTAAPHSRLTASADAEVGQGQMISAHIHSDLPVVVERAMYFDYRLKWQGGHNTLAASVPASQLYFAEGYTGNPSSQFETWVLIQNTAADAKVARVDYILMTGEVVSQELALPAHSRTTVFANQVLGRENLEFSIHVTSTDGSPTPLAERAMYFHYVGPMGTSEGGHDVVGY